MGDLANIIREKTGALRKPIGNDNLPSDGLEGEARELLKRDRAGLNRLGQMFTIGPIPNFLYVSFNKFLAETLMRDGSLLLDQCVQERRVHHDLRAKWLEARIQVDELRRLNEIAIEEEEIYKEPAMITKLEAEGALEEKNAFAKASGNVEKALALTTSEQSEVVQSLFSAAISQSLSGPGGGELEVEKPGLNVTPRKRAYEHIYHGALVSGNHNFKVTIESLAGQLSMQKGQSAGAGKREEALTRTSSYKSNQSTFQIMRNDVARLVALRRAEALYQPNGELNYGEQLESLEKRFKHLFEAAWARLSTAAKGLEYLYNYPLADFPNTEAREWDFDKLVVWCLKTNVWLAAFQDMQQVVTFSFSLRKLMTENGASFESGREISKWRFNLGTKNFGDRPLVRIRGLAVQILTDEHPGSWNIKITPPKMGLIQLPNAEEPKPIEQDHIGTLFLGRVTERTFAVAPEGVNPPRIHNASPIGNPDAGQDAEWEIELVSGTSTAEVDDDVKDIDIHLIVALL